MADFPLLIEQNHKEEMVRLLQTKVRMSTNKNSNGNTATCDYSKTEIAEILLQNKQNRSKSAE